MRQIPAEQVHKRLRAENPWWAAPYQTAATYRSWHPRAYHGLFQPLIEQVGVRRAVLLMGPRRVGKTVLLHHAVQSLLDRGADPRSLCYIAVDHPIYNGCGMEELIEHYEAASGFTDPNAQRFIFFDEVQYLRDWEVHLKALVDSHPRIKFVASGSAAAALRLKSHESGAGRFTDFLLPPLTFHEYLDLLGTTAAVRPTPPAAGVDDDTFPRVEDIHALNTAFIHYLNFGGYPEVIFSDLIQSDPGRFIKNDIVDKVLLRDLPGLYGIQDVQELNYLFTTLAYNTAQEVSLEQIAQRSGVAKNTIKRYIEYLEAAFLLKVVHRIDRSAKRFQRANFFKVYLTNPSIRAALFSPIDADDDAVGALAETGIFSQWFHWTEAHYYARWQQGEVDIVGLGGQQKPLWAVEVKWSDRYVDHPSELRSTLQFCHANQLDRVTVTTRTRSAERVVEGITIRFVPASLYCWTVGRNVVLGKHMLAAARIVQP
ncbi:MAG: ATP-binding protein [Gemmatimonadetes bacterium]|nr:ATP-binding protein [Gemmatimonadota bacterium]